MEEVFGKDGGYRLCSSVDQHLQDERIRYLETDIDISNGVPGGRILAD